MTIRARVLPRSWRAVFAVRGVPGLLAALAVSYLGDAMSAVTVAWLAIEIAPTGDQSLLVGAAVAAYALPGVIGTFAFARVMRRRPSRLLVIADSLLRAAFLGLIAVLRALSMLGPLTYVALLALSSLLLAWGIAGRFTLMAELVGPESRLVANSLQIALSSATLVIGPGIAGVLVALWGAGPLIGLDAASYAVLAIVVARTPGGEAATPTPVETSRAADGLRLMRRYGLVGVVLLTWSFYFLYGPVEVALPLHVSQDLHRGAGVLGLYWAVFGVGAAIGSLLSGWLSKLPLWPTALVIVVGWGSCLVPFAFSVPLAVTVVSMGLGGLVYGPYVPLTYGLFQSRVELHQQAIVLAARSALLTVASPLGTAFGGPLTAALGARWTLAASGLATIGAAMVIGVGGAIRRRWTDGTP
jgi:MFS family permease